MNKKVYYSNTDIPYVNIFLARHKYFHGSKRIKIVRIFDNSLPEACANIEASCSQHKLESFIIEIKSTTLHDFTLLFYDRKISIPIKTIISRY